MVLCPAALGQRGRARQRLDRPAVVARVAPVTRLRADRLRRPAGRVLEELRDERMTPRAVSAGELLIGDIANQRVGEGELQLPFDDRRSLTPDQVATLELLEQARVGDPVVDRT